MVNGPDGVKHIYPSLQGGEIWYLDPDDPENQTRGGSIDGNQEDGFSTSANARLSVETSGGYSQPDRDIDHSEIAERGWMSKEEDWRDIEITAHWNFQDEASGGQSPSVSLYCRGANHTDPEPHCPGFKYASEFRTDGSHRFQKEQWHNSYADATSAKDVGLGDIFGHGWFGHKFACYNVDIGGGQMGVKLECWVDLNVDNNWVKVDERLDDGGWGDSGDACGGEPDQIGVWGGPLVTYRHDSIETLFRNLSVCY